ncbi:MAG: hypothetical protein RR035_03795 [Oscillibacter sp.]
MQENENDEIIEETPEAVETAAVENGEMDVTEMAAPRKNGVVRVLHTVALAIYLFGGILGLVTLTQGMEQTSFLGALVGMLSTWVSYAIYGSLLLGCSELLRLLERIADK